MDDEPREPAEEGGAEEALEALEVGRLDLVLVMPVEDVLLELGDGLQLPVADLAWIYAADFDLDPSKTQCFTKIQGFGILPSLILYRLL